MQRNITVQSADNKGLRVHPHMEHLLHPFHQGSGFRHHWMGDGENERPSRREECDEMLSSLDILWLRHMCPHNSCGHLYRVSTRVRELEIPTWVCKCVWVCLCVGRVCWRGHLWSFALHWATIGSWCCWGTESHFPLKVRALEGFPMSQWVTPHPCTPKKH